MLQSLCHNCSRNVISKLEIETWSISSITSRWDRDIEAIQQRFEECRSSSDPHPIHISFKDMTIKVFWPDDIPIDSEGSPYGWKLADDWYVAAEIVPSSVSFSRFRQNAMNLRYRCNHSQTPHISRRKAWRSSQTCRSVSRLRPDISISPTKPQMSIDSGSILSNLQVHSLTRGRPPCTLDIRPLKSWRICTAVTMGQ